LDCCHTVPNLPAQLLRAIALLSLALEAAAVARAQPAEREANFWPVSVRHAAAPGAPETWGGAGPFLFRQPVAEPAGGTARGVRPFWVRVDDAQGELRAGYVLYPFLSYRTDGAVFQWSFFELIRRWGRHAGAPAATSAFEENEEFEVFPFWFSRTTADPARNYRALFPIAGTVKNKLTFERLSWVLFPLYVENDKRGATTRYFPWPFLRRTEGAAHGWGVWPLYTTVERPGESRLQTWLWPFGYDSVRQPAPEAPAGTPPRRDIGALPFYARSTGPGLKSETWLWPFFGYTDLTAPKPHRETRYFWPLFVQGRGGDDKVLNRWAPFYSHSLSKGVEKHWYLWPLLRHAAWDERDVLRERTQFLYFLYWRERQSLLRRPAAPAAQLTHVWPLVSTWDSGAGRSQWQFPSPLEVFFPGNEKVRLAWSPFFSLARHEQRAPGDTRTALLWNAVTWEKRAAEERSEFHLGPLLDVTRHGAARRIAIGRGLLGWERAAEGGWRMFAFDFPTKPATSPSAPR
jgi:hypothetical protein